MMSKIFPHATFKSALKYFGNTGFRFGIFGSENMNVFGL